MGNGKFTCLHATGGGIGLAQVYFCGETYVVWRKVKVEG
jgi:hypothetical protein